MNRESVSTDETKTTKQQDIAQAPQTECNPAGTCGPCHDEAFDSEQDQESAQA
ncbi:hypothetical protein GCM10027168_63100 [Streptomyces capparidis]